MNSTTITFRTENKLKKEANELFEKLGMNLSTALNMFMKQAVLENKYPCSLELEVTNNVKATYPKDFFSYFAKPDNKCGLQEEPKELMFKYDKREKLL